MILVSLHLSNSLTAAENREDEKARILWKVSTRGYSRVKGHKKTGENKEEGTKKQYKLKVSNIKPSKKRTDHKHPVLQRQDEFTEN